MRGGHYSGGGRVRAVHKEREDEKNPYEFFEHKRSPRERQILKMISIEQ
jgi:hypothetical protein